MKKRKDELKRKRGALELNSDLDFETELRQPRSDLPLGISHSQEKGAFRSKLHNQIRQQEKDAKE